MSTLHGTLPELQNAYNALAQYAASALGVSLGIADYGGLRTQSDTTRILGYRQDDYNAALASGAISPDTTLQQFRPIAPFGKSYHNYGAAFDVNVVARPSSLSAADALAALGSYAPNVGLRWGGTFSNPDTPHFELAVTLPQAQQAYAQFVQSGGASSGVLGTLASSIGSVFGASGIPTDTDLQAALMAPADDAGDDSGEAYGLSGGNIAGDSQTLIAFGVVIAGLLTVVVVRHFRDGR